MSTPININSSAPQTAMPVHPATSRHATSQGMGATGMRSRFFPAQQNAVAANPLDQSFCGDSSYKAEATTPIVGKRLNYRNSSIQDPPSSSGQSPSVFSKTVNNFFGKDKQSDNAGFRTIQNTRGNTRARHGSIEHDPTASLMGDKMECSISEAPTKKSVFSRAKSVGRPGNKSMLSPQEMVAFQMKRASGGGDFGIDGYYLHNGNYTRHRTAGMWKGPKKTYIDDECKMKAFLPAPCKYAIHKHGSLIVTTANKRQDNLQSKDKRRTLPVQIADYEKKNKFPAPNGYNPNFSQLQGEKLLGCFKYQEKRSQFLTDAMKRGKMSPDCKININYQHVEKKAIAPKYQKHVADKKRLPEFLNHVTKLATKGVSPTTYKGDIARDYQRGKNDFKLLQGKRQSFSDYTAKQKQFVPPPGTYDLKKIDNAYNLTTRGAARGYK